MAAEHREAYERLVRLLFEGVVRLPTNELQSEQVRCLRMQRGCNEV